MKFKELPNGAAFAFASENDLGWQGARGPWAKVDKRSYVRLAPDGRGMGTCIRIGSINAIVKPFAENN